MNRSYCPKCKAMIAWYDNIPVLSFIFLRGKCRHCGKPISWQYPAVEFITGILFLASFLLVANNFLDNQQIFNLIQEPKFIIQVFRDWFLIAVMIVIFVYDLRWYLILDLVTLPACVVVFCLNLLLGISWQNMLVSGIIGGSFFLVQYLISRGKWIGGGDIRLGLLMGLALGWPAILPAIFLSYFIGSIVGIGLIAAGQKKWGSEIPLGVFLSVGTIIVLFFGKKILELYFNFLS